MTDDREKALVAEIWRMDVIKAAAFRRGAEAMREAVIAWAKDGSRSTMSALNSGSNNAEFRSAHRLADWFDQLAKDVADLPTPEPK